MLVIQGLNEDKKNLGEISYETSTTPILSLKDYQSFRSRKEIVDNILRALGDTEAPAIGVWGMGGVGKSTLMKEIIRLAREKNLFDDVAMVDVSQNPDVKKIQGELASWLDLKFKDDENVSVRAARLHKRLKPTDKMKGTAESLKNQEEGRAFEMFPWKNSTAAPEPAVVEGRPEVKQKQVLIILDNIWRGLDLEEIGIPLDGGAVKLLFTSRKQHVLSSEMNCSQNVFKLEVLNGGEPLRLFESIVGEIVVTPDSCRFRSIGKEVVQKCSGLPIVIKAIATALRNCSLQEWEDALVQFKGSKDAYSNLEISYKHLESEELKSLFLVCALTNMASIDVQDLLYYSMGLGLLTGTNTVRSAKNKLKALLHHLQDSSLLLKDDDEDPDYVRIHDVVREVAIRIASRDQHSHLITDELELKEISKEKVENSKAISIPSVKFRKLPEGWECPKLNMFLLYRRVDDPPIAISDSFFEGMKELSVLDFSGFRCDSLPSSIKLLLNLNTLCLDGCSNIEDLTIIGKLKQLQILSFIGSEIARLPKQIGELSELKVLNLTNSKLEVIEPEVLGKLTSLEELHLKGSSFIRWEDERETQPKNAKLSELNNLSNLSTVNIHIHNPSTIPNHLEFGNLAEYIIQIGDVWDWTGDYIESRMLKIKLDLCRSSFLHEKWVQDLLKRTQNLHLDGIKGWLIRSFHELCLDGFQELKHLYLENSSLVQCVARSVSNWSPCTAFTDLESLLLEKLSGLEKINQGPVTANSFSKLKLIKVIDCGKLKSLFSHSMLKCLSQLEDIEVRDCEAMQVIVAVDSVATNTEAVKLEALHRIELHNLPNFMRFCSSHKVEVGQTEEEVTGRSSEIVQQDPCIPTSCTMFSNDQLVSFPLLKSLILSNLPKLKHIWQYKYCRIEVANLEYLEVCSCDDMLVVIPSSLVKEVSKLETLIVRDCGSLQELFETIDGDALNLTSDVEILSRLNKLELSNLPFLRHLWENNHQVRAFKNLNLLKVVDCSSLMNLLPAAMLKSLNQLTELHIKSCKEMKAVFPLENEGRRGETKNIEFQSLVDVWLEDLPNMVTFVWTERGESINFLSLKGLCVVNCPKMRSFSLLKEDESYHDELCFFDEKVQFPKLAILALVSMGSIRKIWHEEIVEQSFCQLEILLVQYCQTLVDVLPSFNMTGGAYRLQFHNLKDIYINHCPSFEGPLFKFAVGETGNEGYCSLSQLEKLKLYELPKLKHVLQPDSHVVVGFPSLVDLTVAECQCLADVFPISTAATLSKLEDLRVFRCNSMRQIFGKDEEAEEDNEMLKSILFPCLRSIIVQYMDSLISLFLGNSCVLGFPSLETLHISWCSKLETFVQRHTTDQMLGQSLPFTKGVHYLFDDKVELPNLKKVELYELSTLQTVWKTMLPCLNICDRIGQMAEINIHKCESLEEFIFEGDEYNGEKEIKMTTNDPVVFHSLAYVRLVDLPNMVAFIRARRDQTINFPFLKELYVESCPKMRAFYMPNTEESGGGGSLPLCFFDHKVLLPKLLIMHLVSVGSMEKIWQEEISQKPSFCQIEQVLIKDCQKLVNVFPANMMGGFHFQHLKNISVRECPSLEGSLFDFGREEKKKGSKGCKKDSWSLPQLEILWLFDLPNLQHVVEPTSSHVYSFPNLVDVQMTDNSCVLDLFPISTAPTLSKLKDLIINRCVSMRHVFVEDKVEEGKEEMKMDGHILVFPCLRSIVVQNLDNLISFFSETSSVFHFPSLEKLEVDWCAKLKTFVQRYTIDELEESASEGVHYLFDDKVELPNLKKVVLYELSTLQTVWKTMLPCLNICDRIGQMAEITILNCESLEEFIFEGDEYNGEKEMKMTTNDPVVFHSLANVKLGNLPNMVAFIRARRDQTINFPFLKELYVQSCPKMRAFYLPNTEESGGGGSLPLCFFDHKVVLPKLLILGLLSVGSMKKIWQEEISQKPSFCQIEQVLIRDCQKLANVFPANMMSGFHFQNLKEISAIGCASLEGSLFDFGGEEKKKGCKKDSWSLPQLETLRLVDLPKLQHVVKPTSHVVYSFPSLVVAHMANNACVLDLFPISTAPTLSKLETLEIYKCGSMRQVFVEDTVEEKKEEEMIMEDPILVFPCLRSIVVQNLDNLISFFSETSSVFHFPSLETLEVDWCAELKTFVQRYTIDELEESAAEGVHYLFDDKVELPNLKKVKLFNLSTLQTVWKTKLPRLKICDRIGQITEITINDCENLEEFIFASDEESAGGEEFKTATNDSAMFHSLANVTLGNLPNMVAFIRARRDQTINFPFLKELYVQSCPKMRAFYLPPNTEESGGGSLPICFFDHKVLLPKLLILGLVSVGSIEKIWQEEISQKPSFCQIEQVLIRDCQKLANVFPANMMSGFHFQNLKEISAIGCASLEGSLFDFGGEEKKKGCKKDSWSLPQLETLRLFDLPKLQHVVEPTSSHVYSFPNLVDVQMSDNSCLIELFPISTAPTLSKLKDLIITRCVSMRHVFVEDKVEEGKEEMKLDGHILVFACLRSIVVQNLDNLISFFSETSSVLHFPSLEKLEVDWCAKLKTFVQRYTIDELEESAAEGVHYFFDDKVELPNLKKVVLYELSTLQTVWKTNLSCLNICDRIGQITEIVIRECEKLEEFIFESDDNNAGEKENKNTNDEPALFHSLTNVYLENLPNMVAFIRARRDQTINFPFLKELYVESCPKMRAFYLPNTEESCGGSLPLCFFDHKVILPELLILDFVSMGSVEKIWEKEISQKSFYQIEQVLIKDCQKLANVFPSNMMGGGFHFKNLKKVIARECPSLEGTLFDFGVEDQKKKGCKKDSWSLPQLETLWLVNLPKLQHVVKPTSHVVYSFPSLVVAHMAINACVLDLFPISTAPTLSKLETLEIYKCGRMRQVFVEDTVEEKKEEEMIMEDPILVFPCLRSIVVQNLDNLISFFSETSSVLHFPSLEKLEVDWCAELKTFVQRYTVDELEESVAEGVHYLFDDKVDFPKLQKMKLIDLSSLQTLWKNEFLPRSDSCTRLKSLDVWNCYALQHIFPPSFAFPGDRNERPLARLTAEDGELVICFRELEHLDLSYLPNLKSFSSANCTLEFPSLEQVIVIKCPKLEVFSSSSVLVPKLSNVLFDEETSSVSWDGDLNTTLQNLPKS